MDGDHQDKFGDRQGNINTRQAWQIICRMFGAFWVVTIANIPCQHQGIFEENMASTLVP